MIKVKISDTSAYLPSRIVANAEIEYRVNSLQFEGAPSNFEPAKKTALLPAGALERFFGSRERRFAGPEEQVSDIAVKAALPIVDRHGRRHIQCLIFSAACADLIEPATANIIQMKLGLTCPVFDLKNACNSFVTAIQVGSALIQSGQYENVLIVNGEKLQDAIQFEIEDADALRKRLAAYTLGDAGAAVLLEKSDDESGIVCQKFKTRGEFWDLCTVPGGGSMYPHNGSYNYFEGKISELRQVFISELGDILKEVFEESGWTPLDIKHYFIHQVSLDTFDALARIFQLPRDRFLHSFTKYGNIAAASIPVNLHEAVMAGKIQKGDQLMFIGFGAGISIGLQTLVW